jgi:hypothetical protein
MLLDKQATKANPGEYPNLIDQGEKVKVKS